MNNFLYNAPNRLILIIDGTEYTIREPNNWKDAEFSIERTENHGFTYKFPDSDVQLGFHDRKTTGTSYSKAKTVIDAAIATSGPDVTIKLRLEYFTNDTWEQIDEIELAVKEYEKNEYDSILKVDSDSDEKQLKDLFETKVNLYRDEDLDGNSISRFTPVDLWFHGKVLRLENLSQVKGTDEVTLVNGQKYKGVSDEGFDKQYVWLGYNKNTLTEIDDLFESQDAGSQFVPFRLSDQTPNQDDFVFFITPFDGDFTVSFNTTIAGVILDPGIFDFSWFYQINDDTPVEFDVSEDIIPNNTVATTTESFVLTGLNEGDKIYFYGQALDNRNSELLITNDSSISITVDRASEASSVKSYPLLSSLQKVMNILMGSDMASDFFTPAIPYVEEKHFTTGSLLKGGELGETTAPVFTLKDALESLDAIFNLGWNIEKATPFLRVEDSEYFYNQDNEIIDLSTRDIYNLKERIADEYIFNEAEFGYPDLRYDELNTIDEFNTKAEYLLSTRKIKNKYSKISKWKTQGYDIEFLRRQALKTDSTAFEEDKDIYLVEAGIFSDSGFADFNSTNDTIKFRELFGAPDESVLFMILKGRSFTITVSVGDDSNDGTYTFNEGGIDFDTGIVTVNESVPVTESGAIVLVTNTNIATESQEKFAVIQNVISPETVYNAKLSPARNKMRHDVWLNASQHYKEFNDVVRNTFYDYNGEMITRLFAADDYYDPERIFLTQNQDFNLAGSNQKKHWVIPVISEFTTELTFSEFLQIKDACQGGTNKYGYIRHKSYSNDVIDAWILNVRGKPTDNQFRFVTLWWRINSQGPPPPPDFWTDENLNNILTSSGGDTISWT